MAKVSFDKSAICIHIPRAIVTFGSRSPLAPLRRGEPEAVKVPLLKGDLGGSRLSVKTRFLKDFSQIELISQ
ncbi:hypothetical protein D0A37_27350 [Microcoleus vaginatus HSN003]|nr:hypothetical protein D0A37_27350 [Microcoleus vaginatus HSN003]